MLIYSMSVSVDGYIADREGGFGWTVPSDELFRFHTAQVPEPAGIYLGRRLYETMQVGRRSVAARQRARAAFPDVWCAISKVVFSRTLDSVQGMPGSPRPRWQRRPLRRWARPTRTSRSAAPVWPRRLSSSASSTNCAYSAIRSSSVAGRGLLLVPAAFTWPTVWPRTDPPWDPALVYPPSGIAELWAPDERDDTALEALLGRRRARILLELERPASTLDLSKRMGVSPGGISEHLGVLRRARLVVGRREGRRVVYARTVRGDELARGSSG